MKYLKSPLVYLILIQFILGTLLLRNAISVNGDCGEFAAVVKTLSIAHPPGYATYVVISKIFSSVFPDSLFTFSLNLLSFLCHAVVSLLIFKMCHRKTSLKWLSACFSLFYFLIPAILEQAIIIEVYTLALLCIAIIFYLLESNVKNREWIIGIILGLAPTVHQSLLFMLPVWCGYLLMFRPELKYRNIFYGFFLGLISLVYYPLRAGVNFEMNIRNPHEIGNFLKLISGMYGESIMWEKAKEFYFHPNKLGWVWRFVLMTYNAVFNYVGKEVFIVIVPAMIGGIWMSRSKKIIWATLSLFYVVLSLVYILSPEQGSAQESEVSVHFVLIYFMIAIWLLYVFEELFKKLIDKKVQKAIHLFLIVVLVTMTGWNVYSGVLRLVLKEKNLSELYSSELLEGLGTNDYFVVAGDNDEHLALYEKYIKKNGVGPHIINALAVGEDWYTENLKSHQINLKINENDNLEKIIENNSDKTFYFSNVRTFSPYPKLENRIVPYKGRWRILRNDEKFESSLKDILWETKIEQIKKKRWSDRENGILVTRMNYYNHVAEILADRKYNNLAATMLGRAINVQSNKNPEIEEFKRKLFMKMISLKHGPR